MTNRSAIVEASCGLAQDADFALLPPLAGRLGVTFDDATPPRHLWLPAAGGLKLHALDWGGEGPPAVLVHGGSLTCRTWDYVALALRGRFRVLAPDLRGHGDSDWADDYPVESYVSDVLAVMDGLGISHAHVCGMSLGGLAACEFALAHPARVGSLAMVDVVPRVDVAASARMRGFIADFPGADSVEQVVETAMEVSPLSDPERLDYRMRTLLRRGGDGRLDWKWDRRRVDLDMIVERVRGLDSRVGAIDVPFLLARGGRSRIVSEAAAEDFVARFADGRSVDIADAGHNVQEDNPRDLAAALADFWTERPR